MAKLEFDQLLEAGAHFALKKKMESCDGSLYFHGAQRNPYY